MRIGVLPYGLRAMDGGFHYQVVFLNALAEIAPTFAEEFLCVSWSQNNLNLLATDDDLKYRGLTFRSLHDPIIEQEPPEAYLQSPPPPAPVFDPMQFYPDPDTASAFTKLGVDLILQLGPYSAPFTALKPFVMAIYDLNHRLQPEFPEVSANGEAQWRDYMYRNTCKYATFVLVDSEAGRDDVLKFYGDVIDADRIRILPYYPPIDKKPLPKPEDCARVAAKYHLPKRFFFYPAQFWQHKNHAAVLRAARLIQDQTGEIVPLVFCGSYGDYYRARNFSEVRTLVGQLGLGDRCHYLGVVPDADMAALYALSAGLVMPTFFGPTNLPPLEAWHYGKPVITSDIRGVREQIGDGGLLVDPRSPEDLAGAMLKLWRDEALCVQLVANGKKRLAGYSWSAFVGGTASILKEACERVRAGNTPSFPKF